MNKIMVGAVAALVASVCSADISSANVVGYNTEVTHPGFNFVMPSFRTLGGTSESTDLQLLQLGDEVSSWEVSLQFLTDKRRRASGYMWIDATEAVDYSPDGEWPEGQGLWIDEDTSSFPEDNVVVGVGNAVQMDFADYDGVPLKCVGQVSDVDLTYLLHAGFNYVGNPFSAANDIQNIQLDDSVASWDVSFQFLTDKRRRASGYMWIDATEAADYAPDGEWPEGLGLWIDEDTSSYPEETVVIAPGGAVQFDMADFDGVSVTVYAPYEL